MITVESVTKTYGGFTAVDDVSFTVATAGAVTVSGRRSVVRAEVT